MSIVAIDSKIAKPQPDSLPATESWSSFERPDIETLSQDVCGHILAVLSNGNLAIWDKAL